MPIIEEPGIIKINTGKHEWVFDDAEGGIARGPNWMGQLSGDGHGIYDLMEIPMRPGSFYGPPVVTSAAKACTANTIYYVPLVLWKGFDFDAYYTDLFQVIVTCGKIGGRARIGIYDNFGLYAGGGAQPGELFLDAGEIVTSSSGAKSLAIDPYPLIKGLMWIAIHNKVQSTTYAGYTVLDQSILGVSVVGNSIKPITGYTEPRAYADGLPEVATATTSISGMPYPVLKLFPRDWIYAEE